MDPIMIAVAIVVVLIVVLVIAVFAAGALFCGDIACYTATGNKTLSPPGAPAGKALVVYNPGLSGAARQAAENIADNMQSKGYTVNIAGIKSPASADITGYDVVIAGGPMYFGRVSNSVDAYLNGLKPQNGVKLGVFGTTGAPQFNDGDIASFGKQVAALPYGGTLKKAAVTQTIRTGAAEKADCAGLVSAVL